MGRLIDADDVVNVFTNRLFETLKTNLPCVTAEENQICLETCYKIAKYEIDNIPTAYDVEKVVAELEEGSYSTTDIVCGGRFDAIRLNSAIGIVKRGGVK